MSEAPLHAAPTLRSDEDEGTLQPPLSGWAVLSLVVGLSSLLVPVSLKLLPLSAAAILLGLLHTWRLSRPGAEAGLWMATLSLGLGFSTAIWGLTANNQRSKHLVKRATEFAQDYMRLLSAGHLYNAMELRLPFGQRQPSDVDLQAFYEAYEGEVQIDLAFMSFVGESGEIPQDPAKIRKSAFEKLKVDEVTQYALKYPDANWVFKGIRKFYDDGKTSSFQVVLQADQDPKTRIIVEILRNYDPAVDGSIWAEWRVNKQEIERLR